MMRINEIKNRIKSNQRVLEIFLLIQRVARYPFVLPKIVKTKMIISRVDYVVVRRPGRGNGLFASMLLFLPQLRLADENRKVSVIDMQNYVSPYKEIEDKSFNVWNVWFEDACSGVDVAKAVGGKHIFADEMYMDPHWMDLYRILRYNKRHVGEWANIYKKYVRLKEDVRQKLDDECKRLFGSDRILGVKVRGTDYTAVKPVGHFKQPSVEEMIEETDLIIQRERYDKIYLSTEDGAAIKKFRDRFGNKLIVRNGISDDSIPETEKTKAAALLASEKYGALTSGENYIIDIYALARTSALLTAGNSGAVMAIIINDCQYEKVFFMYRGNY